MNPGRLSEFWYNNEHRHSGIAMLTLAQIQYGNPDEVLRRRHQVTIAAWLAHPERFTKGMPRLQALPTIAWINPPPESPDAAVPELAQIVDGMCLKLVDRFRFPQMNFWREYIVLDAKRNGSSSSSTSRIGSKGGGENGVGWKLVSIALALTALGGGIAIDGCAATPDGDPFEYGICKGDSVVSNYTLNGTSYADFAVSARLWFACAYTYNSTWTAGIGSGIDCFDPLTPPTKWESQDWAVILDLDRLGSAEGCGDTIDTAITVVEIVFDVSSGLPRGGAMFDVMSAAYINTYVSAWDADYLVTDGQIIIITATSGEYSYEIRNLTLTKTADHNDPDFSACDTPDTVVIESVSATCQPTTDETCGC